MTKAEVIKALECCVEDRIDACDRCPVPQHAKDKFICCRYLAAQSLEIINRQTLIIKRKEK